MFDLKFTPSFARQRAALVAETTTPHVEPPESVRHCLAAFVDPKPITGRTETQLWLECIRAIRPLLLRAALFSLTSAACAASSTLVAMQLLKPGTSLRWMWLFTGAYFLLNCSSHFIVANSSRLRSWVGLGVESFLAGAVSRKLLRLSARSMARQSSGNLKVLITSDVKNVGMFLDNAVRNLVPAITALVVVAPLLVYFAGRPGLFGIVVMASVLPVAFGLNKISAHFQGKSQGELDQLTALAGEWVRNVRLIRYLSWDEAFRHDVSVSLRRFMSVSVLQHFMACLIFGLSISWWMMSISGVVLVSRWMNYPLNLSGFFGSLWLLTFLAGYFTHLPNTIRLYGLAGPSLRRIARLLAEEEQSGNFKPGTPVAPHARPSKIILENVFLTYTSGAKTTHVIDDLSLELQLDTQLAVIGEVGSGKTTLLKLLCGELPPSRGRILVQFDTGEVSDLWAQSAYDTFRRQLAYVPQEPFVSSDLLYANITLSEDAPADEALTAAYWAELETDIAALPLGLSQEIGESGVNLSGGQRQRVNLARAFFSGRPYMVLDDTLSAVDTKTEAILMERLVERPGGFILVTHRTGELMRVERVMVMKQGKVVEQGDPKELAANPESHLNRVLRAYDSEPTHG